MRRGFLFLLLAALLGTSPALADWYGRPSRSDAAAIATPATPKAAKKPAHKPAGKTAGKLDEKTVNTSAKKKIRKPAKQRGHARQALKNVPLPKAAPRAKAAKAAPKQSADAKAMPTKDAASSAPKTVDVRLPPPKPSTGKKVEKSAERPASKPVALPVPKPTMRTAAATTGARTDVPTDERLKIQFALMWAGDYAGVAKDDDPLRAAVRNFQKRHKAAITGTLTPKERTDLLSAADHYEKRFGWHVVTDPATGIRIGLPTKLVPNAHDAEHGTRWSAAHGDVQVETFRLKDPDLKLADVFAEQKRQPRTRRVERSDLHDDSFSIHGMQGLKYFDVRAEKRDGEIRGFTLLYDQAMEGIVAPVANAMASAFAPFPARNMPFAALAKPVEYGTGLIVSAQGDIITDRKVADGCQVIVVAGLGNAARIAVDERQGLALLRVYGQRKLPALALPPGPATAKALTVIGIPDPKEQQGGNKSKEIKARLVGGTAIDLRQPVPMAGISGAAVLGDDNRVLGMVATRNAVLASNGPALAPVHLVPAAEIREFLAAHGVTPATAPTADARNALVRVICVRK